MKFHAKSILLAVLIDGLESITSSGVECDELAEIGMLWVHTGVNVKASEWFPIKCELHANCLSAVSADL